MVKRYRPWSDHGGSPILEEVAPDGMIPPGAPEIHPDYDTRVVLADDYDRLKSALLATNHWLVSALTCKDIHWDEGQKASATEAYEKARALLASPASGGTVGDT